MHQSSEEKNVVIVKTTLKMTVAWETIILDEEDWIKIRFNENGCVWSQSIYTIYCTINNAVPLIIEWLYYDTRILLLPGAGKKQGKNVL